jgi:hypothetical protein
MGLIFLILLAVWGTGAWMFSKKAGRYYQDDQVFMLAALWPIFLITNGQFRENFNKSLKP